MSTASTGRAREHKTRRYLEERGWTQVMRAAGSKGSADLLMGHPEYGGALIQVGTHNKRLGPADRARLLNDARLIGALALLVAWPPRKPPLIWVVTNEPPGRWSTFNPQGLPFGSP